MLDIKFIRENPKLVEEKAKQKGYVVNIEKLLKIDEDRRKLIEEVDKLRSDRKKAADSRDEKKGLEIKKDLKAKEDRLEKLNEQFYQLIREVPNLPAEDVKVGRDETENEIIRTEGKRPTFSFKPKDHLELGLAHDMIDVDRASKVSGPRFGYLKNELAILEFAIVKYALDVLTDEGFIPVIPPQIISRKVAAELGYPEYESGDGYRVDGQFLIGTAEHSIIPMHADETMSEKDLPKRYVGFSTAFRREAGSYGRDTRGIFRVHQFDKVEMVSFVLPQDDDREHKYLLSLEEKMVKEFGLAYRVVKMTTGDLGFPTARKYDIEVWMPSQDTYRETHSASTNTDFQARRLNIKYLPRGKAGQKGGTKDFVHILNATAFAIGRTIIAIVENYQQKDGSILIPKALQKYAGFEKIPS